MEYSKFQKEIFKEIVSGKSNIVVSAVAGSGKTTTIEESLKLIPKNLDSVYLAFNNSIVEEMRERLLKSKTKITTIHALGWRSILMTYKNAKLVKSKSYKHIETVLTKNNIKELKVRNQYIYMFSNLIDLVRQNLVVLQEDIITLGAQYDFLLNEDEADMIIEILRRMNLSKTEFDFTDMLYRPICDSLKLPVFDFVFVDEAQDLSKVQQEIVRRLRRKGGRMIAVGDPQQAIYGFAGADAQSYSNLIKMFLNTKELPLSVNYRCAKRIVEEAQKINSQILPYANNIDGEVRNGLVKEIGGEDFVLCRNVKPLVQMNMYLLHKGVKSYIKGQDIGIGLIKLIEKFDKNLIERTLTTYSEDILKEMVKLKKKGVRNPAKTEKIDLMNQKMEILNILSYQLMTTLQLKNRIKTIFMDNGTGVMLSTIHKAKGTENKRVFLLLPDLIPSQYATSEWQMEQESNLLYVAITRAKQSLIYLNEDCFKIVVDKLKTLTK